MKKIVSYITLFSLLTFSVQAQQKSEDITKNSDFENLKSLLDSKEYVFEGDWAYPLRGTSISLIGNPNSLEIKKDSVDIYLPFFGVSQMSSYDGEGGFKYVGPMKEYSVEYNDDKSKAIVTFNVQNRTESLDITLTASKATSASLTVTSNRRDFMRYDGDLKKPEKKE
ncbi:MAG: DUF4251 domain-containing protein [Leeuwenhoekiella sp.]